MAIQNTKNSMRAGRRVRERAGQHAPAVTTNRQHSVQYMFRTEYTQVMGYRENNNNKIQMYPVPSDTGPYGGRELRNASETGATPDNLELLDEKQAVGLGPNDYKRWKNICHNAEEWANMHGLKVSIHPNQSPAQQLANAVRHAPQEKFNIALIHPSFRTNKDMRMAERHTAMAAQSQKKTVSPEDRFAYKRRVEANIRQDPFYQQVERLQKEQNTDCVHLSRIATEAHKNNLQRENPRTSHQQHDDASRYTMRY